MANLFETLSQIPNNIAGTLSGGRNEGAFSRSNQEIATKKSFSASQTTQGNELFSIGSPKTFADIPVDVNVNAPTRNTLDLDARRWADSRTFSPVDARTWIFQMDSPNATQTTKKSDKIIPTGSRIDQSGNIPISQSGSDVPVEVPVEFNPSLGGGFSNILLIVGLGAGGYFLYKGFKGKKKK